MNKTKTFLFLAIFALSLTGCGKAPTTPHEHDWNDPTYEWTLDFSSCTATRVCRGDASHVETETQESTYQEVTSPNCLGGGVGRYTVTFESESFVTQTKDKSLSALGHNWENPSYEWSEGYATCTASRICLNDNSHIESETVDSVRQYTNYGCEYGGKEEFYATFTNPAFQMQKVEVNKAATGHNWSAPTYEWSEDYSSCTAETHCTNEGCSYQETSTRYSTFTTINPATCLEDGKGRYSVAFNSDVYQDQSVEIVLSKTGHNYNITYEWANDNKTCIARATCINDSSHVVSETKESEYEVINPSDENNEGLGKYTVSFGNELFESQEKNVVIPKKVTPKVSEDGKIISYGMFPSERVVDSAILGVLNKYTEVSMDENGYYEYSGIYYKKVVANPLFEDTKFKSGTAIRAGNVYWFKCLPVEWEVVEQNSNDYTLICRNYLSAYSFYKGSKDPRTIDGETVYPSNYEYSDVREYLNNYLLNLVFWQGSEYIKTVEVNNSLATTHSSNTQYYSNNTQDKMYLPSYQDFMNIVEDKRSPVVDDYGRAAGYYINQWINECSYMLTRSATEDPNQVFIVTPQGGLVYTWYSNEMTLRPMIVVTMDE